MPLRITVLSASPLHKICDIKRSCRGLVRSNAKWACQLHPLQMPALISVVVSVVPFCQSLAAPHLSHSCIVPSRLIHLLCLHAQHCPLLNCKML